MDKEISNTPISPGGFTGPTGGGGKMSGWGNRPGGLVKLSLELFVRAGNSEKEDWGEKFSGLKQKHRRDTTGGLKKTTLRYLIIVEKLSGRQKTT